MSTGQLLTVDDGCCTAAGSAVFLLVVVFDLERF